MPFGESSVVPQFLRDQSKVREEYLAGSSDSALLLGSHRLGLSICYEDILHRQFRSAVTTSNPDLLVNLTSDSWFPRTAGPGLHLNLARLRAIEHRRFLLRSTTTGATSLISPTGEVIWSLPSDRASSGVAAVRWLRGLTIYERFGDWPWLLALPMLLVLCGFNRRRPESPIAGREWEPS
jgi:apolipoprotein N-acyltransferase